MKRVIDLQSYARRQHFEYFSSMQYPYVGVTTPVDVTGLVRFCKEKGYSFYLTFLHIAALAADDVPQLRQRIHGGGIVEYKECPTSHTELLDNGTYCYCTLRHHIPLEEYIPMRRRRGSGAVKTRASTRKRTARACISSPRCRGFPTRR